MPEKTKRKRSTFYYEGKRYEATGKTQAEADKKAAIKEDKLRRGEIGISSNMTVKLWAEEWLKIYKKPALAQKQYDDYKSMIDNIIVPAIGSQRLSDVKDVHLQKILNSKAGWSLDRLSKLKNRLNAMFRQAYASRLINRNPAEFLILPKATNGTHRSITDIERKHFLKVAATHPAGLMFKVMLDCGLRTGEVVALSWKDIDFEKRRIKVSHALESGTDKMKDPKTAAGIREVPMPDDLYKALLERKGEPFEPVFVQQTTGRRHTSSSRNKAWQSLKKEIDISMGAKFEKKKAKDDKMRMVKTLSVVAKDFTPYCLRHTYATDLQRAGVPINVAKYLLGHANISVTANIYTHISDASIDAAAGLINNPDGGKDGGKPKRKNAAK